MNRPHRSIEIFTMSALDLFVTAMGSFAILMMILFPYSHEELLDPVKTTPANVLVCVWPTRLQDFEQFVKEVPDLKERGEENRPGFLVDDNAWRNPGYEQQPNFPVVGVTLPQAKAFCRWLTKKERASGTIGPADEYRLPTDAEWSAAAGPAKYPWGRKMPPPKRAGNFGDETWAKALGYPAGADVMKGYTDQHEMIAPVGSYKPNRFGLYDMAGNVQQWCGDYYDPSFYSAEFLEEHPDYNVNKRKTGEPFAELRGSTWQNFGEALESQMRSLSAEDSHPDSGGFRCVLVVNSRPRSSAPK